MKETQVAEPPSCLKSPMFMVGRDSHGNWVVQDQSGVRGGLFIDRAEALRFVRFENGNHPQAFVTVNEVFELDMSRRPGAPPTRHRHAAPAQGGLIEPVIPILMRDHG
jgi:hypothetical protein